LPRSTCDVIGFFLIPFYSFSSFTILCMCINSVGVLFIH
jgi:hypothetical protein